MNGTEDEVIDYIEKCRKEFKSLPPEEVAFPRTVSNVEKWKSHLTCIKRDVLFMFVVPFV